jgi:lysozyme
LAADAGEDARSILAALGRAKTAKGAEKAKHIAAAQTELRNLNPKQHGKLINALQAKVLALQGRGRDTAIAHLEPGEMVVPRAVLTPQLVQLIAAEAAKRAIDPKQLIVGSRKASINPATGAEEFGWFGDLIDDGVNTVQGWFGKAHKLDVDEIPVTGTQRNEVLIEPITVSARHASIPDLSFNRENYNDETFNHGSEIIKKWEGLRNKTYPGPEGNVTGGYGHNYSVDKSRVMNEPVSQEEAERYFRSDFDNVAKQLNDPRLDKLSPQQRGAVISLGYNIGVDKLKKSNTYKNLLEGNYDDMARNWSEFRMHNDGGKKTYSDGLENRSGDELDLFFGRNRLRQPGDSQIYEIPGGSPRRTPYSYKPFPGV